MKEYNSYTKEELLELQKQLSNEYSAIKAKNLNLDMSRGKPDNDQLKLSVDMLGKVTTYADLIAEDGTNSGNYGAILGIPEARRFMADILDVDPENVFVGGNSSLNLMHDTVSFAHIHGFPNSKQPWSQQKVKFLCPSPGYDRHFSISSHFNYELIQVDMTPYGPDMDQIEELVKDPTVKGMWSIPKYSNPTGITYSDETVKRLAALKPAAEDFKILWDNAYSVHHLDESNPDKLLSILGELKKQGNEDMVLMFSSTSKVTFPGSGISAVGASKAMINWLVGHMSLQTISYDKINQIRHAKMFPTVNSLKTHMTKHAALLNPKFDIVINNLNTIKPFGIASWEKPNGGYFISLDVLEGCAKRVVQLCKEAGVVMTPAGATHPNGIDTKDRTIRIAPTFPPCEELKQAAELLCLCVKIASVEKYLV